MKRIRTILITALMLSAHISSSAQVAASIYNVNRNDFGTYDFDDHPKHNRPGRILVAAGMIVGGLAIGAAASQQDYYIGSTSIYGIGGALTLVATGLVLGGANCLNREIKFSYIGNGLGVSMCLNPVNSQKRRL